MVNLESEPEIRLLYEKLNHLIVQQQQELFEIQQIQLDTMNDILSKIKNNLQKINLSADLPNYLQLLRILTIIFLMSL